MIFGKLVDGQIVEAPQEYTSDKGKYIKDFPKYLSMMYKNRFLDGMYGYTDIEELTKVTNEEKIKKLEEENAQLKSELTSVKSDLEDISMYAIESNVDMDYRLTLIEINAMSV